MILYDYHYDLLNQPFFTRELDEVHKIIIKFIIPEDISEISGFKIKLAKNGCPGSISYKLGSSAGAFDLGSGEIYPEEVLPVFETFVCRKVPSFKVVQGTSVFLEMEVASGKLPMDGYKIFGPSRGAEKGFDSAETVPYWWNVEYSEGMAVPHYYKPALNRSSPLCNVIEADGTESSGVSFGFCTGGDGGKVNRNPVDMHGNIKSEYVGKEEEQRFEFIRRLVAPPFSEWNRLYCSENDKKVDCSEILIDDTWGVKWEAYENSPLAENIKTELYQFFNKCFSINLKGNSRHIIFSICEDNVPEGNENHTLIVADDKVEIIAGNTRGLMRAVHYIEDIMRERKRPILKKGNHSRKNLYEVRMTNGIYPAPFNYFMLQSSGIWTDGYLWRMAGAGYNALWMIVNLEELADENSVFPELNPSGADIVLERLKRLTIKAAEHGLDVYLEIRTGYYKYFNEKIYDRLPQIKTFKKWGNYPCTGHEAFKKFLYETVQNLFDKVKKLKGLLIIYDTEGFYNCFLENRQEQCPICRGKSSDKLAAEFFKALTDAMKSKNENARLLAWTYYCDKPWNYRLIGELPKDISVLACYSQFVDIERNGVKNRTDDYACCVTGPSEYFEKVYYAAASSGLKILAKTEVSFGQEFVGIPYIPSLAQHQRRWDSMREKELAGYMGDYIHRGFVPSPCTDLMRQNIFETKVNGHLWLEDPVSKLEFVASLNYGRGASRSVVEAWDKFSEAMSEYFPYSPGVCRYPGPLQASPSQPFYLDKNKEVKRRAARYNTNDLQWTKAYSEGKEISGWDSGLLLKCFKGFVEIYEEGIKILKNCHLNNAEEYEGMAGMLRIAEIQVSMVNSMINFINFINLRDGLDAGESYEAWVEIRAVCEKELKNAGKSLELCKADSNLGFSCEGQGTVRGGYFTPYTIQNKLDELMVTIDEIDLVLNQKYYSHIK